LLVDRLRTSSRSFFEKWNFLLGAPCGAVQFLFLDFPSLGKWNWNLTPILLKSGLHLTVEEFSLETFSREMF